jgi:hypothetical protein
MEESPPRAEGEKGLPLRAEVDVKSGGHIGGGSPTSSPGSPLMAMETKRAATASIVSDGGKRKGRSPGMQLESNKKKAIW